MMKEHGMCQKAERYYFDCLEKDCRDIPDEVLQHLNTCEHCHHQMTVLCAEIKRGQQEKPSKGLSTQHYQLMDQWVCCEQVRPFLSLLAMSGQDISVITPVTAYIDRCPDCARDFQTIRRLGLSNAQLQAATCFLSGRPDGSLDDNPELISTLEQIVSRPSSSVVTRTAINADVEIGMDDEIPFNIEQAERIEHATPLKSAPVKHKTHRYPIARIASMAAVLVLAAYLLLQPATVTGFGISDVYNAMGQVVNVCIKTVIREKPDPIQTVWISNSLQKMFYENQGQTIVWDMESQTRRIDGILQQGSGQHGVTSEILQVPWGLLPFKNLSEIPKDYEWTHVESIQQLDGNPVLVYDYSWRDGSSDFYIQRKWRGFLDVKTKLPQKVEWWEKLPGQNFKVVTTQIVEYPTDQQIEAVMQQGDLLIPTP